MTWESFYLVCFLVGFLLSLISVLGQFLHVGGGDHHIGHAHAPDLGNGAHGGHAHGGHVHAHAHGAHAAADAAHESEISKFNFMTITAFLAWFGGTGYLLERYSGVWVWFAFALSTLAGLAGATIVFVVLSKLLKRDYNLNPADYDMVGVLGRVSSVVRPNGVGEIVFTQEGVRRAAPVRSENGTAIEKGAEVVVTRYESGIAYVRRWEELSGESMANAS